MTAFSRFRSQPSGNSGAQHDIIHSDCHVTMRTGESMQRVKLVTRMPPIWFSRCRGVFFNLGPRALEMAQAPRYLNPALAIRPVRHRPQGPAVKGPPTWKLAFNTVIACLPTTIVAQRSLQYTMAANNGSRPKFGLRDLPLVSRNNLNLHFH